MDTVDKRKTASEKRYRGRRKSSSGHDRQHRTSRTSSTGNHRQEGKARQTRHIRRAAVDKKTA